MTASPPRRIPTPRAVRCALPTLHGSPEPLHTLYRGFTLIELLVVVAIISLLSSVVFASLNSAREKARDARRLSDMRQMQTALEFYYDRFGGYPIDSIYDWEQLCRTPAGDMQPVVAAGFLPQVPCDPINSSNLPLNGGGGAQGILGGDFGYFFDPDQDANGTLCTAQSCPAYCLWTNLEAGGQYARASDFTPGTCAGI